MPIWKCPLCGNAYHCAGEQRPLLCEQCASWIHDNDAPDPTAQKLRSRKRSVTHDEERVTESRDQPGGPDGRESESEKTRPQFPMIAVASLLFVVALGIIAASRVLPLAALTQGGVLFDETIGNNDLKERTFSVGGPWILEWSIATADPVCLSSVQVWNENGNRIGAVSSPSGRQVFYSIGDHRMVVHPNRLDRVRVVVRSE